MLVEGLPGLVNCPVVPAGFGRSPQACRDPGLITWKGWDCGVGGMMMDGRGVTPGQHSPVKQGVCEEGFTYWSISDSTAKVQPPGFRTAEGDT